MTSPGAKSSCTLYKEISQPPRGPCCFAPFVHRMLTNKLFPPSCAQDVAVTSTSGGGGGGGSSSGGGGGPPKAYCSLNWVLAEDHWDIATELVSPLAPLCVWICRCSRFPTSCCLVGTARHPTSPHNTTTLVNHQVHFSLAISTVVLPHCPVQ